MGGHGTSWGWRAVGLCVAAAVVLVGVLVYAPGLILPALGALALIALTLWFPEIVLALVIVLTLAGGTYASYSAIAVPIMLLGGGVSALAMLANKEAHRLAPAVGLPLAVLGLIAVRFLMEGDVSSALVVARGASTLLLTLYAIARGRDVVAALALAAVAFAALSFIIGETSAGSMRLMGWSGNPNRMVFGLLLLLPFLLGFLWRTRRGVARLLSFGAFVFICSLLVRSGSSQAFAGIVVLAGGLVVYMLSRTRTALKISLWMATAVAVLLILLTQDLGGYFTQDLATLSGRTDLYAAAWNEFLRNPVFGTGTMRVSDGAILDRSAHSSLLGFLAAGGLLIGIPWVIVLVRMVRAGVTALSAKDITGLAAVLLVVEQFVQSVEFVPLTWSVIAYFLVMQSGRGSGHTDVSETYENHRATSKFRGTTK